MFTPFYVSDFLYFGKAEDMKRPVRPSSEKRPYRSASEHNQEAGRKLHVVLRILHRVLLRKKDRSRVRADREGLSGLPRKEHGGGRQGADRVLLAQVRPQVSGPFAPWLPPCRVGPPKVHERQRERLPMGGILDGNDALDDSVEAYASESLA